MFRMRTFASAVEWNLADQKAHVDPEHQIKLLHLRAYLDAWPALISFLKLEDRPPLTTSASMMRVFETFWVWEAARWQHTFVLLSRYESQTERASLRCLLPCRAGQGVLWVLCRVPKRLYGRGIFELDLFQPFDYYKLRTKINAIKIHLKFLF